MALNYKRIADFNLKILLCIVLILSMVFVSKNKVEAAAFLAPAVAAGTYTVGTGAYVTGALGVAAVAGALGYVEYQEEINEYAKGVWNDATDLAKNSITASIEMAQSLGSSTIELGDAFYTWFRDDALPKITQYATALASSGSTTIDGTISDWRIEYYLDQSYSSRPILSISDKVSSSHGPIRVNGEYVKSITISRSGLTSGSYDGSYKYHYNARDIDKLGDYIDFTGEQLMLFKNAKTYSDFINVVYSVIPAGYIPDITFEGETIYDYGQSYQRARDAIPSMDAGVVVYPQHYTTDGQKLTYTDDGTFVTDAGTVYTGDIDVMYDTPYVGADGKVKVGAGTNVFEGATAGEGVGEGELPPSSETTEKLKEKSRNWGQLITTRFPFSLPWDLYFVLSFLASDPITPKIEVDENYKIGEMSLPFKFSVNLSFLDPYIKWFRFFIVLGFLYMLIMVTRRLLGGAQ